MPKPVNRKFNSDPLEKAESEKSINQLIRETLNESKEIEEEEKEIYPQTQKIAFFNPEEKIQTLTVETVQIESEEK